MNDYRSIDLEAPERVRLRVRDMLSLDDSGAFEGYGHVELIDGELLYVNAQHRPHMVAKSELAYRLRRCLEALGSSLFVGTEGSVQCGDFDLPQPDILLTNEAHGPGVVPGGTVALVVEVADTTLGYDLHRKRPVYAAAGIPEYWIVDLNARVIRQFWSPADGAYAEQREVAFGNDAPAATIPGLTVATTGL